MTDAIISTVDDGYSFVRKLHGGVIPDLQMAVTESTVRALALQDGDVVQLARGGEGDIPIRVLHRADEVNINRIGA